MIVTDRMVFLHLHKSGGTFVNALLMRCIPGARHIGYHLPYRELPSAYRDRPIVGTVRNPWAYYVSWYHFQISRPRPNMLFRICSDNGRADFDETISNLVGLSNSDSRLELLETHLPDTYRNSGLNLTKRCVGELRESGLGFYSFLYERLYAGAHEPVILRQERLRQDLRNALSHLGHLPNSCADRFLDDAPPLNVSRHDLPSHYYHDRLAALVATRDRKVIDRHGYKLSAE